MDQLRLARVLSEAERKRHTPGKQTAVCSVPVPPSQPSFRERYERDGFIVVKGLLKGPRLSRFLHAAEALLAIPVGAPVPLWKFYEDCSESKEPVLIRVERFTYLFPEWRRFALEGELHRRTSALLGEEAVLFKEKLIVKPPGGDAIGPHQEMHTDWREYGDSFLVAAVAIDRCTSANGCLEVTAGDHKRGLIGKHGTTIEGAARRALDFRKIRLSPGDCLFFDAWTPHQSGPNLTGAPRRILFLAYNRRSAGDHYERYFNDKAAQYWPGRKRRSNAVRVVSV